MSTQNADQSGQDRSWSAAFHRLADIYEESMSRLNVPPASTGSVQEEVQRLLLSSANLLVVPVVSALGESLAEQIPGLVDMASEKLREIMTEQGEPAGEKSAVYEVDPETGEVLVYGPE